MASLADHYKAICNDVPVKANSAVVSFLEGKTAEDLTSWDLTGNVVGSKGATAIARLAKAALPELTFLGFAGNNLGSAVTEELYKSLVDHPTLTGLDLSGNDIRLGGPALVELIKKNKRITQLDVQDTYLRPLFERLIAINVQNNKNAAEKHKKTTRFTFGDAAPADENPFGGGADGGAPADEEPFGAFGNHQVTFAAGSQGGRKVKRRPTVSAEVIDEADLDSFVPQVNEKSEKNREWLFSVLERHDLFSHLEDRELYVCVDAAVEAERDEEDQIFCEGDEDGDLFYVIASGEVDLIKGEDNEVVKTLRRGDATQDLMLLYPGSYPETAKCLSPVTLYSLDRTTYRCAVSQASKKKRAMYEGFLGSVSKFKCLTHLELLQLADALKPAIYEAGQKLIKYGEDGTTFFLIVEGTVEVFGRDDSGEPVKVCEFTTGDCIGELEFLNHHKCVADVAAKGQVRTAKMNRHHFEMVMGSVKEILARTASEDEKFAYYREQLEKMGKK